MRQSALPSARGGSRRARRPAVAGLAAAALALGLLAAPEAGARDDRAAVSATLREYMAAYQARDIDRLGRVWDLSPLEASLIKSTWKECDDLFLSVTERGVRLHGDRAEVDFDQDLGYGCARGNALSQLELRATLARTPKGWRIREITSRDGRGLSAIASRGVAPTSRAGFEAQSSALAALDEYRTALSSCDLGALSRVWIMNRTERSGLEGFCRSFDGISVAVQGLGVEVTGDKGILRFAQRVSYRLPSGEMQNAMSSLRAALIRRSGGEWAIWSLREGD